MNCNTVCPFVGLPTWSQIARHDLCERVYVRCLSPKSRKRVELSLSPRQLANSCAAIKIKIKIRNTYSYSWKRKRNTIKCKHMLLPLLLRRTRSRKRWRWFLLLLTEIHVHDFPPSDVDFKCRAFKWRGHHHGAASTSIHAVRLYESRCERWWSYQ